jgi:cytochrome P450
MYEYDPFLPKNQDNPYPFYKILRDEHPAYYVEARDIWMITRYEDVMSVLQDTTTWSSQANGNVINDNPERVGRSLGTTDPPRHGELRKMLSQVFTPKSINALEPLVRKTTKDLIAQFADTGSVDIMSQFAGKLTASVVGHLLGVPEEDHPQLSDMVDAMNQYGADGVAANKKQKEGELINYVAQLVEKRAEDLRDDLISDLLRVEGQGGKLDRKDIVMMIRTMIGAAFESTKLMIGNVVYTLYIHPEQLAEVRSNPKLIPGMIEEAVRWDPSTQGFQRTATRDVEIGGTVIPKGSKAFIGYASANHDERQFKDADRFDIHREVGRHLGFGWGIHLCIGAPLARLELSVAFEELLPVLGDFKIDMASANRRTSPQFRGFLNLPVKF